jgi:multicomponent Na+:H+ antiporter subunit F
MMIVRAMIGPSHYDRILAVELVRHEDGAAACADGLPVRAARFSRHRDLVYALINFVTTIALMKFFRYRTLARPLGAIGRRGGGK